MCEKEDDINFKKSLKLYCRIWVKYKISFEIEKNDNLCFLVLQCEVFDNVLG